MAGRRLENNSVGGLHVSNRVVTDDLLVQLLVTEKLTRKEVCDQIGMTRAALVHRLRRAQDSRLSVFVRARSDAPQTGVQSFRKYVE